MFRGIMCRYLFGMTECSMGFFAWMMKWLASWLVYVDQMFVASRISMDLRSTVGELFLTSS